MGESKIRIHDGEMNIMELLWSNNSLAAKDIAKIIKEYIGLEKNTTYTVINRLIGKGAVTRTDPGFICRAAISKKDVQKTETEALFRLVFDGSLDVFLSDYLSEVSLTSDQVKIIRSILNNQYKNLL